MRTGTLVLTLFLIGPMDPLLAPAPNCDGPIALSPGSPHSENLPQLWFEENSTEYHRDSGRYDLDESGILKGPDDVLDLMVSILVEHPLATFQVRGTADVKEAEPDSLAMARAKRACEDLAHRGVAAERLIAVSLGSDSPVVAEDRRIKLATQEEQRAARALNRSVYFHYNGERKY